MVNGVHERSWVKRVEANIKKKISRACQLFTSIRFNERYVEAVERVYHMPGIPHELIKRSAFKIGLKQAKGHTRSRIVNNIMIMFRDIPLHNT